MILFYITVETCHHDRNQVTWARKTPILVRTSHIIAHQVATVYVDSTYKWCVNMWRIHFDQLRSCWRSVKFIHIILLTANFIQFFSVIVSIDQSWIDVESCNNCRVPGIHIYVFIRNVIENVKISMEIQECFGFVEIFITVRMQASPWFQETIADVQ